MSSVVEIKIMNLLESSKKPLSDLEISNNINVNLNEIYLVLEKLNKETKIRITKKGKYEKTNLKFGNIRINKKGFGYIDIVGETSVFVSKINLKGAIDGDYVSVAIIDPNNNEGKVVRIINHEKEFEVGEVYVQNNQYYAKLDEFNKRNVKIQISNVNLPIVNGSKVKLNLLRLIKNNTYEGEVKSIICHVNDPESDILCKAEEFGIDTKFSEETIKEANEITNFINHSEINKREDLRNKNIFTIDGDNSKDFDDAVSIEILDNGNYLLGVHIADVSYYVKKGSFLDREAASRGVSSYLANRVIPMLPPILSNGICSLNPNEDRLTKSCEIEFDVNGKIIDYRLFDSVINSKKRMTYTKVNQVLNREIIDDSYLPYVKDLELMQKLSNLIRQKRKNNGCIDFNMPEMEIVVDENGKVLDVINPKRMESEKIIEDFMISANICVAEYFSYLDLPAIYRIHEKPKEENIEEFFKFIKTTKEKVTKLPKNISSRLISDLLEDFKDSPNFEIYSSLLLRSMKKAKYSVNNIGHFGLSEKHYLHFTSPIRRYSDLMVHRLLDEIKYSNNINNMYTNNKLETLDKIANHVSFKEDNEVKCEREINKMKSAEFMIANIGNKYEGKIVSVNEKGMFINIYNGIEGFVKYEFENNIKYNKEKYSISILGKEYKIGDIINVILVSANKDTGNIDLKLNSYDKKLVKGFAKGSIYE